MGQVFSATGFWGVVGNGALTGAGTGGIVSLINGDNFLEGLAKGAVIGGGVAAISYSVNYFVKYAGMKDEFKYYDGNGNPTGNELEYSNKTLQKMRNDNFTPEEIKRFKVGKDLIGSEQYSQTSTGFFQTSKDGRAYAYTTRPNFFSGNSNIHYAKAAFASKRIAFYNHDS